MSNFVLVHGAWGGAWIWRRVIGPLRSAGHEVHAVTLTGDGERAHLRHAGITLQDHIDDLLLVRQCILPALQARHRKGSHPFGMCPELLRRGT